MKEMMRQSRAALRAPAPVPEILNLNNQELDVLIRKKEQENPLIELKTRKDWLSRVDEEQRVYYEVDAEDEALDPEEPDLWKLPQEEEESLTEFVFSQLSPSCATAEDRRILFYLADSLDERGYLTESNESLRRRFGIRDVDVYRYRFLLQSAEPAGIGAGNLVECLLLQLDRLPGDHSIARRIVIECLELLGENNMEKIRARLGISLEEAERSAAVIRRLNPRPGSGFRSRENLKYVLPDVTVVKFPDYMQVLLNDSAYPQIRISRHYSQMLHDSEIGEDAKAYIRSQIQNVEDIREAIRARGRILTDVTRAVVELEMDFFEKGPGNRHGLTYSRVAELLDLTAATVECAVRDKYLQCTWGIYPLNIFFGSGAAPEILRETEVDRIREKIRRIIREEDKAHPFSDRRITELLHETGEDISRRTVAKYRAAMGIPDAGGRKVTSENR